MLSDTASAIGLQGLATLAAHDGVAGFRAESARVGVTTGIVDDGRLLEVSWEAVLSVRAQVEARDLALWLPRPSTDPLDLGPDVPLGAWRLEAAEDVTVTGAERALAATRAAVDPAARPARGEDRQWVALRWPEPVAAGEARTVAVRWSTRVPWDRTEVFPGGALRADAVSPPLGLGPRVAGQDAPVPWSAWVWAPDAATVVVSGQPGPIRRGEGHRAHRVEGVDLASAVLLLGDLSEDRHGDLRVFTPEPRPGEARGFAAYDEAVARFLGVPRPPIQVAVASPGFRPPHVRCADGVGLVHRQVAERRSARDPQQTWRALPQADLFGALDAAVSASVGGFGTPSRAVQARALGRAFALTHTRADTARPWGEALQDCASTGLLVRPFFGPERVHATGFAPIAAACALPLVYGPMLDDRFGHAGARRVRQQVVRGGDLSVAAWRRAALAVDPSAGSWVDRWIRDGQAARIDVAWRAARRGAYFRVEGTVSADAPMGTAPVVLRAVAGGRHRDVAFRVDGATGDFSFEVPFRPRMVVLDPERRLLRMAASVQGEPL